jgi:hypothetical protein
MTALNVQAARELAESRQDWYLWYRSPDRRSTQLSGPYSEAEARLQAVPLLTVPGSVVELRRVMETYEPTGES